MRSILRLWAWVHPVLIGRRDEEHGPFVQLRLLPSPSGSLPPLRSRQHLLLQALRRHGAPALSAPFRAALPGQPLGPSQACGAPAALSRTSPVPENRASGQKVTHHPLTRTAPRPVLARTPPGRPGTRPIGHERPARVFRCDRCGRFCGQAVYPGLRPLRQRRRPEAAAPRGAVLLWLRGLHWLEGVGGRLGCGTQRVNRIMGHSGPFSTAA